MPGRCCGECVGEYVVTASIAERGIMPVASGRQTARTFGRLIARHRGLAVGAVVSSVAASAAAVLVPLLPG